ncbi:MBOAT family protein [Aminipila butyrica]|uniref:MBOAT family protein n=1 Tax=Aminipila butyrica TaxID=433296 RepID=A0A858C195_9FIRM|nr:MBOAT family protein [Aminipila butyrica]QIB70246.1 MBOAT family protein [Aminipila butyrica]
MVFSSISFLIYFLPVVICLHFLAPASWKNPVLLLASLIFYAWGEPIYVFLMIFSILFNYGLSRWLDSSLRLRGRTAATKGIFAVSAVVNLGILGFFKYSDFLIENINLVFTTHLSVLELPLPVGISFYTFQLVSYTIDLYRGKVKPQRDLIAFGTYVAMFPQLVAGPIVRIQTIEEQLIHRPADLALFASGVRRFTVGLGKKVLLADNMGLLWGTISGSGPGELPVATAWLGALAFTMQIYFDFSGYSDMAIGLGRMFGFTFLENFNYPYVSKSVTEFWRRWHISLGSWFKEYVYIPLGGNRQGNGRQMLNILIVWGLTGLWHGASWNFVLWGLYFAVILVAEKLVIGQALEGFRERHPHLGSGVASLYTMGLVTVSWVIFAAEDMGWLGSYGASMAGLSGAGLADCRTWYLLSSNLLLLGACAIGATNFPARLWHRCLNRKGCDRSWGMILVENIALLLLFLVSFAYVVASTYKAFLYFRF